MVAQRGAVVLAEMQYSLVAVRMNRLPFAIAGVARVNSSSGFLPTTLNSGPSLDHVGRAIFVQREELAVVGPGRRREHPAVGGDALAAVDFLAGL